MIHPIKFYLSWQLNIFTICSAASIFTFTLPCAFAAQNWQESLAQGNDYLNQNAISRAENCFAEAVKKMDLAPHTVENKIQCLNELANTYALQNKTITAKITYEKSLTLIEHTYGKRSPKALSTLFALGSIYEGTGDHEMAMQFYKKAIDINEKHYGPYSPIFTQPLFISNQSNSPKQAGRADKYSQVPTSQLIKEASLDASKNLENLLPGYKEDTLKSEDGSDQDLLFTFSNEIAKIPTDEANRSNIAVSPNNVKQSGKPGPSRRI